MSIPLSSVINTEYFLIISDERENINGSLRLVEVSNIKRNYLTTSIIDPMNTATIIAKTLK